MDLAVRGNYACDDDDADVRDDSVPDELSSEHDPTRRGICCCPRRMVSSARDHERDNSAECACKRWVDRIERKKEERHALIIQDP